MGLDVSSVIEYEEVDTANMSEEDIEELFSLYQSEHFTEQLGDIPEDVLSWRDGNVVVRENRVRTKYKLEEK